MRLFFHRFPMYPVYPVFPSYYNSNTFVASSKMTSASIPSPKPSYTRPTLWQRLESFLEPRQVLTRPAARELFPTVRPRLKPSYKGPTFLERLESFLEPEGVLTPTYRHGQFR